MANWSRALLSLGEGLGQLAERVGKREHDAMLMAREENLVRLRAKLEEQGNISQFGRQKELIGMEEAARGRGADREEAFTLKRDAHGQAFETTQAVERRKHELTMAGREEAMQRGRWKREDLQQFERSYAAQVDDIDDRIVKVKDKIRDDRARSTNTGVAPDESVLAERLEEITQLQGQKSLLVQQRGEMLANMGDTRYGKISPEEARRHQEETRRLGASSGDTDAAQAPASDASSPSGRGNLKGSAMPTLGPKPQGMIDREQRKQRKVTPEVTPEEADKRRAEGRARIAGAGTAGQGVGQAVAGAVAVGRGVRQVVGGAHEAIESRKQEPGVVKAVKQALQSGRSISAEQRQELQRIGRERLKGVYRFTDDDLDRARVHR